MARQESMAAIDAALQSPQSTTGSATGGNTSVVAPHVTPGVQTPTPIASQGKLTADEKRYLDAQRQAQSDLDRQSDRDVQQQQEREGAFNRSANATVNAASGIVRGTQLGLASLPTPGSLMLPLAILLVFFFLLLPVNGHTRLVWLWLVLTSNAEIQQQSSSSTPGATAPGVTPTTPAKAVPTAKGVPGTSPAKATTSTSNNNSSPYGTQLPTWSQIESWVEDVL